MWYHIKLISPSTTEGPGDQTQVIKLCDNDLYLLSCLTSPTITYFVYTRWNIIQPFKRSKSCHLQLQDAGICGTLC